VILLNLTNLLNVDSEPFIILPFSSLLIFASIGFISFSVGFQILHLYNNSEDETDNDKNNKNNLHIKLYDKEINNIIANQIGECFLFVSKYSAAATLGILLGGLFHNFQFILTAWIIKYIVILLLIYIFGKTSYFFLITLKKDVKSEMDMYENIRRNLSNHP